MTQDLSEIQATLKKRFGKDVLFQGSDPRFQIRRLSTRILTLDRLLGGGVPLGRIIEFYGAYSALKSLALLMTIAEAQSRGVLCALADTEKSFDPDFAGVLGVDVDALVMVGDLETGEEIVDYIEVLIRSGKFGVIGIDSIAAFTPKDELEESAEKSQMGKMGKLTSKMMRKLTAVNGQGNTGTTLILINQVRENPGISFGNPEKPVGGRAIGFFASQRVEFRRGEKIKRKRNIVKDGKLVESEVTVGRVVQLRIEKDKTGANAEQTGSFDYYYNGGIDRVGEVFNLALLDGLIEQVGKRFKIADQEKTYYRKQLEELIGNDAKVKAKLLAQVRKNHRAHTS